MLAALPAVTVSCGGARIKSVKTAWTLALRRAGITDLHFHDLRREAGSRLIDGLVSPHYVKEFLGHADLTTTSIYLAMTRTGMRQVMKQYEQRRNVLAPAAAAASPADLSA